MARLFAAQGAHVILTARTTAGLEETDDAVRAAGGTATLVPLDLRDFDQIDRMGAAVAERFGRLESIIINLGPYYLSVYDCPHFKRKWPVNLRPDPRHRLARLTRLESQAIRLRASLHIWTFA